MKVLTYSKKQLSQSMLSGVPQIIQVRGFFRKLVKFLVLIACMTGCIYQIWSFMEVFWTYPINVNNIVSLPNVIGMPAFTICEFNGMWPNKFCATYARLCTPMASYKNFCKAHFYFCNAEYTGEPPIGTKVPAIPPWELPRTKNSLQGYKIMGNEYLNFDARYKKRDLKRAEISVFNSEGLPTNCFAYNVVWDDPSAIVQTISIRNEIDVAVKMTGKKFYNTTPFAIQMVVHSPLMKLNPFIDGFSLKPCTTYKMYLDKIQNYLLPAPYHTNCTDYQDMWRKRGGHGPLTKKMCIDECIFNKSIELYGCYNPNVISNPNDTAEFCFDKNMDDKRIEDCDEVCQLACYDERIQVNIEELESSFTSNQKGDEECKTRIIISFARTQIQKFIYNKKYEGIEAFGYIGGFLGMWLGLSLIAVLDFLETCFIILLYTVKRLKNRNKKTSIKPLKQKTKLYI